MEPGLCVSGKKVHFQVVGVEMGEVARFTFLPLRLLPLLVAFGVHIQFALGRGCEGTAETIVFRLRDLVVFFVPVISEHVVCRGSKRTLFTLKPSFWIVDFQVQFEIVRIGGLVFTLVTIMNDLLVLCFYVPFSPLFCEPPKVALVARISLLIVNLPSVHQQLKKICFEITVVTWQDLVFPHMQHKMSLNAAISALVTLYDWFFFRLCWRNSTVLSCCVHIQGIFPSASVIALVTRERSQHVFVVAAPVEPQCVFQIASKATLFTLVYFHLMLLFLVRPKQVNLVALIFALATLEYVIQSNSKAMFGILVLLKSYGPIASIITIITFQQLFLHVFPLHTINHFFILNLLTLWLPI